jgi:hypothetical protein
VYAADQRGEAPALGVVRRRRDEQARGVAVVALDRELVRVAVAAVSLASSFAIATPRGSGTPSGVSAASYTSSRAAVIDVDMSASLSWIAWCWQIGTPNVVRCCE